MPKMHGTTALLRCVHYHTGACTALTRQRKWSHIYWYLSEASSLHRGTLARGRNLPSSCLRHSDRWGSRPINTLRSRSFRLHLDYLTKTYDHICSSPILPAPRHQQSHCRVASRLGREDNETASAQVASAAFQA